MTTDKYNIRDAKLSDLNILKEFEQGVIEAERPYIEKLKRGKVVYYDIPELINRQDCAMLVVDYLEETIACGYAKIEESKAFMQHEKHGYLGFMFVKPEHRGQGVIRKLISALISWCENRGVYDIKLEVFAHNDSAVRAYEKCGFGAYKVEMLLTGRTQHEQLKPHPLEKGD